MGGCQCPDRDTFVELVTSEELAEIERRFRESRRRLNQLLYEAACQELDISKLGRDASNRK